MFLNKISRHVRYNFRLFRHVTAYKIDKNINNYVVTSRKINNFHLQFVKQFNSSIQLPSENEVSSIFFEQACSDTLESLTEFFEEVIENTAHLKQADVNYSDGVLTVNFGEPYGTYVINRQTPNKQIWLSSPISGPKRYDLVALSTGKGYWVYKHDGVTLHKLLTDEISKICQRNIDFSKCAYFKL